MKRDMKYREIEEMLFEYPLIDAKITKLKIRIEMLEAEDGVTGISYDKEISSTGGNSSITEQTALDNLELKGRLEKSILRYELRKKYIETYLETLNCVEKKVVEDYYFQCLSWPLIAKGTGYSTKHCQRIRLAVLDNADM